jgi:hypothetical protein
MAIDTADPIRTMGGDRAVDGGLLRQPRMTEPISTEWRRRVQAAGAESLRRRAARATLRQEMAKRRRHGLDARHAAKLSRRSDADRYDGEAVPDAPRARR